MLKPLLARGELHVVGATTLDEYRKHVEKDAALERRFQPVLVGEPSVDATVAILPGRRQAPGRRARGIGRDEGAVAGGEGGDPEDPHSQGEAGIAQGRG